MKTKTDYSFMLGMLLILAGAAPLNGWIGFQFFPEQFHINHFVGSIGHLLIGALPFTAGIILLICASAKLISLKWEKDSKFSVYIAGMMFLMLMPLFALEVIKNKIEKLTGMHVYWKFKGNQINFYCIEKVSQQ